MAAVSSGNRRGQDTATTSLSPELGGIRTTPHSCTERRYPVNRGQNCRKAAIPPEQDKSGVCFRLSGSKMASTTIPRAVSTCTQSLNTRQRCVHNALPVGQAAPKKVSLTIRQGTFPIIASDRDTRKPHPHLKNRRRCETRVREKKKV